MKLSLYILLSFAITVGAVLLLTRGPAPENHSAIMFALVILFGVPPLGAFWMMYVSIRHEKNPVPLVFLAFIPFSFLWYYFERVRPRKLAKKRDLHQA